MNKNNTVHRKWLKGFFWLLAVGAVSLSVFLLVLVVYLGYVTHQIDKRMEQLKNRKPTQYYALIPPFKLNQKFTEKELKSLLWDQGYVPRTGESDLSPGEYQWLRSGNTVIVSLYRSPFSGPGHSIPQMKAKMVLDAQAVGNKG